MWEPRGIVFSPLFLLPISNNQYKTPFYKPKEKTITILLWKGVLRFATILKKHFIVKGKISKT